MIKEPLKRGHSSVLPKLYPWERFPRGLVAHLRSPQGLFRQFYTGLATTPVKCAIFISICGLIYSMKVFLTDTWADQIYMWDWPERRRTLIQSKCLQRLSGNTGFLAWQQGINKEDIDRYVRVGQGWTNLHVTAASNARLLIRAWIWTQRPVPVHWEETSLLSARPSACPKLNRELSQF